jgi:hypothetical protein
MPSDTKFKRLFIHHIALPQDHGSWVFLISPLLIGFFAGKNWSLACGLLTLVAFAVFLIRQPVSITVKVYSGRRSKRDLPAAFFWTGVYGIIALLGLLGLIMQGFGYLLLLAIPGIPVFIWHLFLISKRSERRQIGIEIVGSGVLALSATAAYWVSLGIPDPLGWWLFLLAWFQSAASIVYAYLRLEQRLLNARPDPRQCLRMGKRAIRYTTFNLIAVSAFSITGILPTLLPIPYALQWGETIWGIFNPAIGAKPTAIGIRQLIVSILFTILFIITWNLT